MESVSQARQLRNFMHHRRENGIELLVSFADHEDYVGVSEHATHTWPTPIDPASRLGLGPAVNQLPIAGSSSTRSQMRRGSRDRRTSHSSERNRRERHSPSWTRYQSSTRPAIPCHRYRRSLSPGYRHRSPSPGYRHRLPSPYYRRRSPCRCSDSPQRRCHRLSRSPSSLVDQSSAFNCRITSSHSDRGNVQNSPIPVIPSVPAALNLPPGALLPFGANIAFMWSLTGSC